MLVYGSIVPPREVREALDAVVRSVLDSAENAAAAHKGLRGRFGRRSVEPDAGAPGILERVPVEDMQLPITALGNLTPHDAHRVTEEVRRAAAEWQPLSVRFAGGAALDFPGDWSVWAKLEGDVDELWAMARSVPKAVERLGFFVDRRKFRPMLSVATVTAATTGPFLEAIVKALDDFRGDEWSPEVSLLKEVFVDGEPQRVEFERIGPTS